MEGDCRPFLKWDVKQGVSRDCRALISSAARKRIKLYPSRRGEWGQARTGRGASAPRH
jgi:hypothetical protein